MITLDMDRLDFRKVSNELFWQNKYFKSIVREIFHLGITGSLADDLRPGSHYMLY